ncbi:hypothetical protein HPP92_024669 [Vanilla planifolia]|uniref:Uncharacterized protein n=1 Tax=Vanilla planifolia TaxID=51239 RepID=A0A835UBD3_VANPL|nr:hypothetical protein HPP92_024669 [Vanilla planifolia]
MGSNDADHRDSESSQIDANRESESSQAETEASVHDVHVVNDGQVLEDHRQNNVPPVDEFSFTNLDEMEFNIRRSCSEITNRISLVDALSGRAPYLDLRRSSMISVDNERHKLENEVDFLRKRLKIIRQGREKLGLSAEHREKETFQLQLLDEISCKLKEFKNVAEPIKNRGRVSLLPPSSKRIFFFMTNTKERYLNDNNKNWNCLRKASKIAIEEMSFSMSCLVDEVEIEEENQRMTRKVSSNGEESVVRRMKTSKN